jgi:gamma-glutamyltranspeptidase/glutathione hydrolase
VIGPDRGGNLIARRNSAWGLRGVVGAAAPEAAVVGRDMLMAGGNAFDAALAAALAETVLLPSKCGFGGDLVALVKRRDTPIEALVAIGTAPKGLARATQGGELPVTGPLSVGVPAAPQGYAALATLGDLPLGRVAGPALDFARCGFAWSPLSHDYSRRARRQLLANNPAGVVYLPSGKPIEADSWVRLPGLGRVLEEFVEHRGALFAGKLGRDVAATVLERGGVLTDEDLAAQRAEWCAPLEGKVDGRSIWVTPEPTHGPSLLQALERHDGGAWPATVEDQAARARRAIVERRRSSGDVVGAGGTSVVTAADQAGNAVVLVHSVSHPTFGSCVVVPGLDLVLGNRAGRGFTAEPDHPNAPLPGRRPVTTLHAWGLGAVDSGSLLLGGTSGGEQQMPWNLQVVERLLGGWTPAEAVLGSLWSVGQPDRDVSVEQDGDEHTSMGEPVPPLSQESGIQVVRTPDAAGVCHVVTDIRSVGGTAAA